VIEVDVDDPVGGAIATHYRGVHHAKVVDAQRAEVIIGELTSDELTQRLERRLNSDIAMYRSRSTCLTQRLSDA